MNKKLKFTLISAWILFSRSYDAYCTYLLTSDLTKEANPLVTILGVSSWSTLLVIIGTLTIYVIYAYFISVFKPMDLIPKEKGYTFGQFITFLYIGNKENVFSIFYKLPKDLKRANTYFGQILTQCLVYAGVVSTIMWLFINYTNFYKTIHSAPLVYLILIGGCLIIAYKWNKDLYKKYLAEVTV